MSHLEDSFIEAWSKWGQGKIPETQLKFHPIRKFRLDFAWPLQQVAVECDGMGGYRGSIGAHRTIQGISNNHEKTNLAIEEGWVVLRFTTPMLSSQKKRKEACQQVLRVLHTRSLNE